MSTDFEHDLKQHLAESARTHEVNLDLDELIARGRQGVRERNQRRAAWAGALCGVGLLTATMVTQQGTRTSPWTARTPRVRSSRCGWTGTNSPTVNSSTSRPSL